MKTHFVTLSLRAHQNGPLRPAGMFLADPVRGVMDNTSKIPLTVFEQIEEDLREGRSKGSVRTAALSGDWVVTRLTSLDELTRWHGQALASAAGLQLSYVHFLGRDVGLLIEGDAGHFRVPIEDARHLIAENAVTGEPAILDLYAQPVVAQEKASEAA
jgi:hypothetical protein